VPVEHIDFVTITVSRVWMSEVSHPDQNSLPLENVDVQQLIEMLLYMHILGKTITYNIK